MNRRMILHPNEIVFDAQVAEAEDQGWTVDPANPKGLFGTFWEVQMLRDPSVVDKPSRREILEKARAAKAAKASE